MKNKKTIIIKSLPFLAGYLFMILTYRHSVYDMVELISFWPLFLIYVIFGLLTLFVTKVFLRTFVKLEAKPLDLLKSFFIGGGVGALVNVLIDLSKAMIGDLS